MFVKKEHILLMCDIYNISDGSQQGHLDCGTESMALSKIKHEAKNALILKI